MRLFFLKIALLSFILSGLAYGVDPKEAYKDFVSGKAVIIDVRELEEVKEGMVRGAQWLPLSKMQKSPDEVITQLKKMAGSKTIYAYCRSGRRSQIFLDKMLEYKLQGQNLGGYNDLVKAGLPTEVGQE